MPYKPDVKPNSFQEFKEAYDSFTRRPVKLPSPIGRVRLDGNENLTFDLHGPTAHHDAMRFLDNETVTGIKFIT